MNLHYNDKTSVFRHFVICGYFFMETCERYYPLANEGAKRYSNATVRPPVTSLWTL